MKRRRKCKRCNGTGRVFEGKTGDDGCAYSWAGVSFHVGDNDANGKKCPRCGGRGEI